MWSHSTIIRINPSMELASDRCDEHVSLLRLPKQTANGFGASREGLRFSSLSTDWPPVAKFSRYRSRENCSLTDSRDGCWPPAQVPAAVAPEWAPSYRLAAILFAIFAASILVTSVKRVTSERNFALSVGCTRVCKRCEFPVQITVVIA